MGEREKTTTVTMAQCTTTRVGTEVLRLDQDCEEREDDREAGDDLRSEHDGYDIRPPISSSSLTVYC